MVDCGAMMEVLRKRCEFEDELLSACVKSFFSGLVDSTCRLQDMTSKIDCGLAEDFEIALRVLERQKEYLHPPLLQECANGLAEVLKIEIAALQEEKKGLI